MAPFVSPDIMRARFSAAMSAMYQAEVPLYGDLLAIVARVNAASGGDGAADSPRLPRERHGAIRVGSAAELAQMRRLFAVLGMSAVGYYDLSQAGIPVHSTAFRPVEAEGLSVSPFRMFCSLLRMELIERRDLQEQAAELLARREICSPRLIDLIEQAEAQGGLGEEDAEAFLGEALEVFRWHDEAKVDAAQYRALHEAHRLIADIVCFKGPHINHLTPRTSDIDAAQAAMLAQGIDAKGTIEGPPRRKCPILLRQTSFKALHETVRFADGTSGAHTARFGEIEQRGAALTAKGRALYDRCLAEQGDGNPDAFAAFPDDIETMQADGLAWFRGGVPLTYEDFLPVSAAGIFRSNLDEGASGELTSGSQAAFEQALGLAVADMQALYAQQADQP